MPEPKYPAIIPWLLMPRSWLNVLSRESLSVRTWKPPALPLAICAALLVVDPDSATLSAPLALVPPSAEQPAAASAAVSTAAPDRSVRGRNLPGMNPAALPGVLIAIFMPRSFRLAGPANRKAPPNAAIRELPGPSLTSQWRIPPLFR